MMKKTGQDRCRILIIDDDVDYATALACRFHSYGAETWQVGSAREGLETTKKIKPDLVLLDLKLPDSSGVGTISRIKSLDAHIPIMMVSGSPDARNIVEAMQAGASDYVLKPFDDTELWDKVKKLIEMHREKYTEEELSHEAGDSTIVGNSPKTKQLVREISKVSNSEATVLLYGESGTGKTMIAEIIHRHSQRKNKPFVTIDCASIPENLLESELFGHEKGSFTGALQEKVGRFELADGGTLFLDEIGDLPMTLQVKLLRVLQGHEFERVGGLKTIRVDVRLIAATNRNLEKAIQERRFREDLFYRINVLPITIPPLRERKEDIPALVEHFLKYFSAREGKQFGKLSDRMMGYLMDHSWPGNIRELQNVIERGVVMGSQADLRLSDFGIPLPQEPFKLPAGETISSVKDVEYQSLVHSLAETGGNISRTAKLLGVRRDTIYRRLKKYQIGLKRQITHPT